MKKHFFKCGFDTNLCINLVRKEISQFTQTPVVFNISSKFKWCWQKYKNRLTYRNSNFLAKIQANRKPNKRTLRNRNKKSASFLLQNQKNNFPVPLYLQSRSTYSRWNRLSKFWREVLIFLNFARPQGNARDWFEAGSDVIQSTQTQINTATSVRNATSEKVRLKYVIVDIFLELWEKIYVARSIGLIGCFAGL